MRGLQRRRPGLFTGFYFLSVLYLVVRVLLRIGLLRFCILGGVAAAARLTLHFSVLQLMTLFVIALIWG